MPSDSCLFKLAVLGHPVEHSLSPVIHYHFAQQFDRHIDYQKIDIQSEDDFTAFIDQSAKRYCGFNVTVPYKQCLLGYAIDHSNDCEIASIAQRAGAANTIAYHQPEQNHHLITNTDGQGFLNHLKQLGVELQDKKILIIGAGGACMGLLAQLTDDRINSDEDNSLIYLCNRTEHKARNLVAKYGITYWSGNDNITDKASVQFDLIINATAQGLDGSIFENHYFNDVNIHADTFFYDLFYRPKDCTPFLQYIVQHYPQHRCRDGLGMLIEQAALSYHLWFGEMPNTSRLENILRS